MPRVAIIGAGLSGLTCARVLGDHGFPVRVFEKSRGVGGRMATRRAEELRIDHGAQFFTVRDERFRRYVSSWMHEGVVAPWDGKMIVIDQSRREPAPPRERFVGTPNMNAIAKHLSSSVDVQFGSQIAPIRKEGDAWQLMDTQGNQLGEFDVVISSAPAAQSAALLAVAPTVAESAARITIQPCWAVMLAFPAPTGISFDAAFIRQRDAQPGPLAWMARNSSKPERSHTAETWVLHAGPEWSAAHIEETPEFALESLLADFWKLADIDPLPLVYKTAHRWRFALPPKPHTPPCLFDREQQVVACGDWCAGPRVEGAFLSGLAAAGSVMGLLEPDKVPRLPQTKQQRLF